MSFAVKLSHYFIPSFPALSRLIWFESRSPVVSSWMNRICHERRKKKFIRRCGEIEFFPIARRHKSWSCDSKRTPFDIFYAHGITCKCSRSHTTRFERQLVENLIILDFSVLLSVELDYIENNWQIQVLVGPKALATNINISPIIPAPNLHHWVNSEILMWINRQNRPSLAASTEVDT